MVRLRTEAHRGMSLPSTKICRMSLTRFAASAVMLVTLAWPSLPAARRVSAQSPTGQPPPAAPPAAAGRGASPFQPPEPLDFADRVGWTQIFDGRTSAGWSGNPDVWRVEDGAIVALSTAERRIGSTHIIWTGGEPADFELKLEMKLEGDIHSGIAYRSYVDVNRATGRAGGTGQRAGGPQVPSDPRWTLYGPGLDFDQDRKMAGNVEERGTPRREIAWRGGIVRAEAGKRPRLIGTIGDAAALMAQIKADGWNQVHIVARGNQISHIVNGQLMTVFIDDDPTYFRPAGLLGLQIEMFGLGKVHFKDIWLKQATR